MVDLVKVHEFDRIVTQNRKFCQESQEDKYSNTYNRSFVAPPQMDHTHLVSNEYDVPKNDGESCLQKILFYMQFSKNT
jgi:hypothetical protein